jgi:hypothetical protein
MEFTYDNIVKFITDNFETFNTYAYDPKTIHRMNDYFAPDLEFTPYVAGIGHTTGRDTFLQILLSHPSSLEKLAPEDIAVDERRKVAVVQIKAELSDSKTGEILVKKRYYVRYSLALDENNTIKIEKINLFWEVLPPGALEIDDVFARDRK